MLAVGEVWNFGTYVDGTNNHSKWLTLQRAPQQGSSGFAIETVKEVQLITNQFSAEFGGHSSGVASMITKTGDQRVQRLGVRDGRPGRSRCRAAARAGRQRREGEGPVTSSSSAARPAARFSATSCSSSAATSGGASAARCLVTAVEAFGLVVPTPADEHQGHAKVDLRFSPRNSLGVRYNMVRWKKDSETGGVQPAGNRLSVG